LISKEIIQSIIETARVEEVISDFVNLKKRGANYVGLCPFHNEKTPSFSVSATKGIYKCFGCGKAGNAVNFIMEHEHYTYPEALRFLAKKYNIEVEEEVQTPEYIQEQNEKESLYNIHQFAQKFFTDCLNNHQEGKAVGLTYLKERDFTDDSIERFQLGFCPDTWKEFTDHALKNGYELKFLFKSGLTVEREGGDHYDRFRGRVIFPIHNLTGRVLGFGGRILKKDPTKPKYVNSPESDIYSKSKVLYGLFLAKNAIITTDNCFLVEGYTDVISLYQNGIQNVVASSGTSLTTEQIRLIKRYTNNITILYDGDEAGLKASFRGIDLILEQGMNVKVVLFPEGEDPDSYARKYRPAETKTYLAENAKDFIRLKTGLLLEDVKNDPVKKAGLIKEIVGSISLIPNEITRLEYTKASASLMNVDEQALLNELNKALRNKHKASRISETQDESEFIQSNNFTATQPVFTTDSSAFQESEIIRLLLAYGNKEIAFEKENEFGRFDLYHVKVAAFIINDLNADEIVFENPGFQLIYNRMAESLKADGMLPDLQFFTSHPDPAIASLAIELISNRHELSDNWRKNKIYVNGEEQYLKQTVTTSLLALKAKKINQILRTIQTKMKTSTNVEEQMELQIENQNFKEILIRINKELGRVIGS
jgi:DNA primase